MSKSFAAIDLGATSGRVVLGSFTDDSFDLKEVHRFPNVPVTIDNTRCWDTASLFNETLTGIGKAAASVQHRGDRLAGVAADSWGVDYGLVDSESKLVAPARHHRAAEQSFVELAHQQVPRERAYRRTGIIDLAINTCFQLMRDSQQGLLEPGVRALLIPDLWTTWLGGERGAERTIASTTGLLDWSTREWDTELMETWSIPVDVMFDLRDACTSAGVLSSELSTRLGIGYDVPIFRAPAHDTSSAFAAVTDPSDRAAVISCGTWALAGCVLSQPVLTSDAMNAGFTNEMSADGSALLVRNLSGTWLMDECIRAWAKADGLSDITEFRSSLIASAKTEDVNVRGVIDCGHPDLITTTNMPELIGQLYRDRFGAKDLDRVHTVRLILESLAASFAETVEQIRSVTGTAIDELVMIGGGSRIEPLVDLTGKTTSLPVRVSYQEATSIGNIATQAVASGLFESIQSARNFISDNLKESC